MLFIHCAVRRMDIEPASQPGVVLRTPLWAPEQLNAYMPIKRSQTWLPIAICYYFIADACKSQFHPELHNWNTILVLVQRHDADWVSLWHNIYGLAGTRKVNSNHIILSPFLNC